MADVHDKQTRSYNMSRIKGKNTKPEMLVRKFLHTAGFRYRLHVRNLPGKPDKVLPKYKTVILFMDVFGMDTKDVEVLIFQNRIAYLSAQYSKLTPTL
jgi:DNA mismatch endonuclease Vsr